MKIDENMTLGELKQFLDEHAYIIRSLQCVEHAEVVWYECVVAQADRLRSVTVSAHDLQTALIRALRQLHEPELWRHLGFDEVNLALEDRLTPARARHFTVCTTCVKLVADERAANPQANGSPS